MNIFEQATRRKIRFNTERGVLATEQLWDVPLRPTDKGGNVHWNLDSIARDLDASIKAKTTGSFVETTAEQTDSDDTIAMEVIKHVIAVKLLEEKQATAAAANRVELKRINDELASRGDQAMKAMSTEDLQLRAKELAGQ